MTKGRPDRRHPPFTWALISLEMTCRLMSCIDRRLFIRSYWLATLLEMTSLIHFRWSNQPHEATHSDAKRDQLLAVPPRPLRLTGIRIALYSDGFQLRQGMAKKQARAVSRRPASIVTTRLPPAGTRLAKRAAGVVLTIVLVRPLPYSTP